MKEDRQQRGPEGHGSKQVGKTGKNTGRREALKAIAPWKQVGKTVKKTGRREALKAMEALEASRKDSKEDRQKRGSWANCRPGSKSERQ